jgi:uncharacterized protein involved in response to NO
MQHVTREQVRPLPVATTSAIEPYRVLFPLGAALAIAGVAPWLALAAGATLWPGRLHAGLMMEGFELSFVSGFLLTAMPAFTHGAKAHASETWGIAAGITLSALAAFAGLEVYAHALAALVLLQLLTAVGGRAVGRLASPGGWGPGGAGAPPEEFLLVGLGLLAGVAGTAWQAAIVAGWAHEPALHLAEHLVSRFMVLALVLGLGGLLVPTFAMMPEPLTILGVARAGDRPRRRAFAAALALLLVGALVAEAVQQPRAAAVLRAVAGAASTLLAWKLLRPEGRRDGVAWAIRAAGWGLLTGLVLVAALPAHEIAMWHVVFVAGYGLLTLGIGTRVVVSHGGHGLADEARVLTRMTLAALGLALALRVIAELAGAGMVHALAAAAACWIAAWALWLARAWSRVRQTRKALLMPAPSPR